MRVRGSKLLLLVSAVVGATALVLGVGAAAVGAGLGAENGPSGFDFHDGETDHYVAPAGVCALRITAAGGDGGSILGSGINTPGGLGGEVEATLTGFTPGETLDVLD